MTDLIGQQLGNYRLIRLLGTGRYADVYLGKHIHLERQAAIKVLHTALTVEQKEDFLIEAQRRVDLSHPSIIRVFDFAIEGDLPYLIMEYAPNGTLRTRHPVGSRLPLATVVSYVKCIAAPLQYIHNQKLVHCDIKPDNFLIGKNREILLSDLGIAAIAHKTGSLSMQRLAGTSLYMAPEQSQGMPQAASDQYALGIVAYEWLCGNVPFEGSAVALMVQHLSTPPLSLCQRVPTLPPAVEQIIFKALAKKPLHRFRTIAEFADALEEVGQPKPDPIPPISPIQESHLPSSLLDTPTALLPEQHEYPITSAVWKRKSPSYSIGALLLIVLAFGISIVGFVVYGFSHVQISLTHTETTLSTPQTPTVQPTQQNVLAEDTFRRPDQNQWGTASNGQYQWIVDSNTQQFFSISNYTGKIAGGQGALEALTGQTTPNVDITTIGIVNHFASAGQCNDSVNLGIVLHWQDPNNWDEAFIDGNQLCIVKSAGGYHTTLNYIPVLTSQGVPQQLRFRSFGSTLFAKVWPNNQKEPKGWTITADDHSFTTGQFGIRVVEQSATVISITLFSSKIANTEKDV